MNHRIENLKKMRDKYRESGQDVAADRVEARIREVMRCPQCRVNQKQFADDDLCPWCQEKV